MNGLKNTIEIYDLLEPIPPTFQNTPLWDEAIKFIDRDLHWYTRRVKQAIHIRLHPDNIKKDNGTEIPETCMSTINNTTDDRYQGGLPREQFLV